MPDFQVIRRKGKKPAVEAPQELTQEDESSLLSKAGAGAMSGLHTVGSILSWPSRLFHGAINAAVGGKEGFGENYLNPFDSRGGVEGSRHLINAGILAENNPHEWEWGDLGRGLADIALDPTTWAGPGLTKAGLDAAKISKGAEGALAAGRIAQTAAGQRALLNIGVPWMAPAISIGTGKGTAEALKTIGRRTGLTAATNAVKKSYPVRAFGGLFNSDYLGKTLPTLQEEAAKASEARRGLNAETELDVIRASRDEALNAYSQQDLRRALESAEPSVAKEGYVPHPMTNDPNLVPHEMIHINPQGKILENFPGAAHNGMVDELVSSGKAIPAPMMHLDSAGKPVFGKGQLDQAAVKKLAEEAYKQELRPLVEKVRATPQWADKPFSVTDVLHSQFPESMNTATIAFRDIAKATGKTPAEIVEALNKEIPGGFSLQRHDFPDQIIHEGRQGEHFWSPKDPGDIGSHDKAFVGFSLRPETGKAIDAAQQAAKQAAPTIPPLHPERIAATAELKKFQKGRKARLQEHAARIAKELQDQHGGDEALALLAKMRDLKEPGMAVMVPRDQAEQIRRLYAGGERTRNLSDTTKAIQSLPEFEHLRAGNDLTLTRQRERGFGLGEELHDKTVKHWPRRESVTKELDDAGKVIQRGSASLPVKTPDDVSRKWFMTGHFDGTEGINGILKDPALHAIVKKQGVAAATELGRQRHGHMFNGLYQDAKQRSLVAKTQKAATRYEAAAIANEQKIADMANNTAINAARESTDPEMLKAVAKHDGEIKRLQNKVNKYRQKHTQAMAAHEEALHAGHDRMPALIKYIKKHPELEGVDKFGNNPLADYKVARLSTDRKYAMSEAVTQSLKRELNKGDRAISLGDYLKNKGFKLRTVAERIAGREFEDAADMKAFLSENKIDSKLAEQLNSLTPAYKAPDAVNELTDKFKSAMAWWKGATLAFPSSRFRDASGGAVWNLLHGWGNKKFYEDAKKLLTGETITTNYGHVPEIEKWLKDSKKEWSPENQTEAIRQLTSVFIPSDHNILADVPTGQIGAGLEQLTHNIPGKQKTTLYNQFIGDPLRALAGKDPGGASWFGRGEPGESTLGRLAKAASHPFTGIRGVGDATETMFAPVKASEIVAANSDAYNRTVPFLQQLHGGTAAPVAGRNVNKVQIDYNPESFTATERAIKNYFVPFYSFQSRILSPTAAQLSNFGSPTSQLIKSIDRSHGGGDASVPDYVMSGTGIPLGKRPDGSKTYLTGLGQMYEPAVSNIGLAAAMLHDPRAAQALAYDSAAMLNPLINVPLQRMTGQSFFQRGAPIRDMDPIVGRMLSNIGESTGLMEPGSRPVDVPGSQYIDTFLGGTPFGRAAGQIRTLADPRKDITSKLVDTLSGAKVTDISPEKQMATLQKRAEDLARSQGAWEQRTVGFPKEQLARLAQTNPQLAAEQQHLQNMITAMKRKRTIRRKQKAAEKK